MSSGYNQSAGWFTTWGTFTYDADTGVYSNVAFKFNSTGSNTFGINSGDANGLTYGSSNGTGITTLSFASGLTNAGGSIDATVSFPFFSIYKSFATKVTAASTASAVPEPEAYALMLAGLGLVGFATRRQLA